MGSLHLPYVRDLECRFGALGHVREHAPDHNPPSGLLARLECLEEAGRGAPAPLTRSGHPKNNLRHAVRDISEIQHCLLDAGHRRGPDRMPRSLQPASKVNTKTRLVDDPAVARDADVDQRARLIGKPPHLGGGLVTQGGTVAGVQKRGPDLCAPRKRSTERRVDASADRPPASGSHLRPDEGICYAGRERLPSADDTRLSLEEVPQCRRKFSSHPPDYGGIPRLDAAARCQAVDSGEDDEGYSSNIDEKSSRSRPEPAPRGQLRAPPVVRLVEAVRHICPRLEPLTRPHQGRRRVAE